MRIEKLVVQGFRNLHRVEAVFPSRVTYIVGPNGQGKTNLLEAVYLLSQAKSFRHSSTHDLLPWNAESSAPCSVEASLQTDDGRKTVSFELEDGRRKVYVNGNRVSKASAFYGQFRAVVFSPDDVQLVKGGPGGRRRFLDRTLSMLDGQFVDHLVSYERALKSRNILLKRLRSNPS
ncbi:MAG: AAA family ATPase, partial [Bdellovibrionales bacterium]|nr:AAA family ATPase [Bdellovibrionales bacterium]